MSFYTSLSGLKAAQTELSTISNNVANALSAAVPYSVTCSLLHRLNRPKLSPVKASG